MYNGRTVLAFIPARSGSKGLNNKNLFPLNGKPLLAYTIAEALKSAYIDKIVCSTNGEDIAAFCKSCGIDVVWRPEELSTDTALTIDAVLHCVKNLENRGEKYDYMVGLQPTSPDRKAAYIDGIIKETIDDGYIGMISVNKINYNPLLIRYMNGVKLEKGVTVSSTCRRQDMRQAYYVNGMLYTYEIAKLDENVSLNDIECGFEVPAEDCIDINTMADVYLWQEKHKENGENDEKNV